VKLGTYMRITKREWYALGSFGNTRLFRKADKHGTWKYYMLTD
jgi:hypothetical protein